MICFRKFIPLQFSPLLPVLLVAGLLPPQAGAYEDQPPTGYTNAPPQNITCAICHTSKGSGNLELVIGDGEGLYIPGETYPVLVKVTDNGQERFGFSMTSRLDSSRTTATGTWTGGNASAPNSSGDHIGHLDAPFASDTYTFNMMWTAPAQDVGPVRFYLVANAANGNGFNGTGDNIYTTQVVLESAAVFESFWVQSPQVSGWRDTGAAYAEVLGFGFLYDTEWPWCFTHSIGKGSWIHIYPNEGNEEAFWAYVFDGGYYIRGFASVGWYYSLEPGAEGWYRFDF